MEKYDVTTQKHKKRWRNSPICIKKLARCFPNCISRIIVNHSKRSNNLTNRLFGFFYGMALATCFYLLILDDLEFREKTSFALTILLGTILGVGCIVSSQLRCITLLSFPSMCGSGGRGTLKAFLIAYLLAGPVANLTRNGKEVVRSFACATGLSYNMTKQKYDLIFTPFLRALMNMKGDMNEIKDTMDALDGVIYPIKTELTDTNETKDFKEQNDYIDDVQHATRRSLDIETMYLNLSSKRRRDSSSAELNGDEIEQEYYRKLKYRCENILSSATRNCRKIFAQSFDNCSESVSWAVRWVICWPMKLTFICNSVTVFGGEDLCDPSEEMSSGWGEDYKQLISSRNKLLSDFQSGTLSYRIKKPPVRLDLKTADDAGQAVMKEFEQKKKFIDMVLLFVKRALALVFIKIVLNANEYHEKYLSQIDYENYYVTRYFKRIDARRHQKGQHTLLPFKKIEKPKFVDPLRPMLSRKETSQMASHFVKVSIELLTAITIILIDRLFYESLDLVRRHSKVEYYQTGSHNLIVSVKGTGMIASIVKSVVRGFNFHTHINETHTNIDCLPDPSELSPKKLKRIYTLSFILLFFVVFEGYAHRIKWLIAAMFYPKREKRRVLYLYNETLKKRKGYFKYMASKVKKMIKDNKLKQDISMALMLRLKYPHVFGWLAKFNCAKRKCLICGEREPTPRYRRKQGIYECPCCLYIYCDECWNDIEKSCYVCNPPSASDDESVNQESDETN